MIMLRMEQPGKAGLIAIARPPLRHDSANRMAERPCAERRDDDAIPGHRIVI
jgi:hypothetical protein